MRICRRELLRQLGVAFASTGLLPALKETSKLSLQPSTGAASPAKPIRLNRNESPYGPCEKAIEAMRNAIADANRYPGQELDDLRAAISVLNGVRPEQITLGCGSGDILRIAAETFLGPGKSLVMATPTFDAIAGYARASGAEVRAVPLNKRYSHDLDAMIAHTDASTGLIYICNPNNPTGGLTPKDDLESFLARVPKGVGVLIDEAYHDFVPPASTYTTWVGHAASDPRLLVTRTLSKVYGMAGLRVGYAVASTDLSKRLAQRRLPMGVNIVAARAAKAAINDQPYVQKILAPELHRGDLVICDNLSSHKVSGVREALAACGAELLYLPAYSPDLNPIELAFAKLKAHLRQAAARTLDELQLAVASSLDRFSASDCNAFFRHAQYTSI